jgi:hypothetical protein
VNISGIDPKNILESLWVQTPVKSHRAKVVEWKILQRKRIDDLELSRSNPKSRGPSDRGRVAREIAVSTGEEGSKPIGLRGIGIRGLIRRGFTPRRIASRDSLNESAPLIWTRTRGAGSLWIGVRRSAFPEVRVSYSLKSRPAISRVNWSRRSPGRHVAEDLEESGFGVCNARKVRPVKSRSRDPRSHERRGDVVEWGLQSEWKTGGVQSEFRGSGFCVA